VRYCFGQLFRAFAVVAGLAALAAQSGTPQVAASRATAHALALKSDGTVLAWGSDLYGQLGSSRALVRPSPTKIDGLANMTGLSVFLDHVVALDSTGRVWAWGSSQYGQLGVRVERNSAKPGRIEGLSGVVQVAAGGRFSAARKSDGTVWIWGLHASGAGEGNPVPAQIFSGAVEIAAGERHILMRKSDGTIWAYGDNLSGQLGLGDQQFRTTPTQIPGLSNVSRIAASGSTSAALVGNALYAWGQMNFSGGAPRTSPGAVTGLPPEAIVDFDAGNLGYIAMASGRLFRFENSFNVAEISPSIPAATPIRSLSMASPTSDSAAIVLQNGGSYVYSSNLFGESGTGSLVPSTSGRVRTQPAGLPPVLAIEGGRATFFALTQAGEIWAWGLDSEGLFGNGLITVTSFPKPVAGLPNNIEQIDAGYFYSMARDSDGFVWTWGNGVAGELGQGFAPPTSIPAKANISGVSSIAACTSANSLYLKTDGTVHQAGMGMLGQNSGQIVQVAGLPQIAKISCGWNSFFAIDQQGGLWAWGENHNGLLGDGTLFNRVQPVQITSLGTSVAAVASGFYTTVAVKTDGSVWTWGRNPTMSGSGPANPTPVQVQGITTATHVSIGGNHVMIQLANGTLVAYGIGTAALGTQPPGDDEDQSPQYYSVPRAVLEIDSVRSISAGSQSSFALRNDGTVFAWGENCTAAQECQALGDGTFSPRDRPVVVLRENALGNLSTNDWHLDLDPAVANSIPAAKIPKVIPVTTALSGGGLLNIDAAINYRQSDTGRTVGVYVVGLVPAAFFDFVKSAPGEKARAKARSKDGAPVLVQLTPAGWTTVTGQLIAFNTATISGNGAAQNILNNVPRAPIPGARFCIGYGSSADDMLSQQTLRDVVATSEAEAVISGSPCILAGIYVSGPRSSIEGTNVSFKATVVGAASPSGTVQLRDGGSALGAPLTASSVNAAVASVTLATSALAVGEHGILADYSGDANNPAARSDALVHKVIAAASQTAVSLSGPASSRTGEEVAFSALVTGRNPTGLVQFKDGNADLGFGIPVAGGVAVLRIATLTPGDHTITAVYAGDSNNSGNGSSMLAHTVAAIVNTEVTAVASNERPAQGETVVLAASILGSSPTGTVVFNDISSSRSYGPASVSSSVAQVAVTDLAVGVHLFTATYSGDGDNFPATSPPFIVVVQPPSPLHSAPAVIAFGGQSMGTTSPGITVTFTNPGSSVITISSLATASPFALASHDCASLVAGGSCTALVRFTPQAQGAQTGSLVAETSAGLATVPITGTGERSLVTHYYRSILNRDPDSAGKQYWESEAARLEALGVNPLETVFVMAGYFFNSPEYLAANKSDASFVTDLYNTFFNRGPDGGGLNFWVGQIQGGLPREVVLFSFMFSNEFRSFTQAIFGNTSARPEVDMVVDFFRGLLNRLPDTPSFQFWLGQIRAAQCQGAGPVTQKIDEISAAFMFNPEYGNRGRTNTQFVTDMYYSFLRRGGDIGGVQYWITQLDTPGSQYHFRNDVRYFGFLNSAEFGARVQAVIAAGCVQ